MTMHLVRGMTTLNTRKKKSAKMTAGKLERLQKEHREHNKHMKQIGCHSNVMTFEEYVDYVHGRYKSKTKPTATNFEWNASGGYRREVPHIPSRGSDTFTPCTVKPRMEYTGERRLIGIATMHKSNMVPVFADDDDKQGKRTATEIAQMRRN